MYKLIKKLIEISVNRGLTEAFGDFDGSKKRKAVEMVTKEVMNIFNHMGIKIDPQAQKTYKGEIISESDNSSKSGLLIDKSFTIESIYEGTVVCGYQVDPPSQETIEALMEHKYKKDINENSKIYIGVDLCSEENTSVWLKAYDERVKRAQERQNKLMEDRNKVNIGPSEEWLRQAADIEDNCCTSVGGLAVELGMDIKSDPPKEETWRDRAIKDPLL